MTYYIDEFKSHLLYEKRVSKNTFENYIRDVNAFLTFKSYSAFPSGIDIDEFQKYLMNIGKSKSTVLRTSASLRCYFNFLHKRHLIDNLPSGNKIKSDPQKMPEILTVDEMERLLSSPDSTDFKGLRDKAILETFYATGIKASELISIKVADVNLNLGYIKLNSGGKERILPMYQRAVKSLYDYLKFTRNALAFNDDDYLFLNMSGSPLTRQGLWKIIKAYAEKTGIDKQITPHTIRHSFAAHLVENGAGIKDVKDIMGFSDISSARVYSEIFKSKYTKAYNRFHPLSK